MSLNEIPIGRNNAVKRFSDDRGFRQAINEANKKGDVIINNGNGYFRPDFSDAGDVAEYEHYMAAELHRAREILFKRKMMKETAIKQKEATNETVRV